MKVAWIAINYNSDASVLQLAYDLANQDDERTTLKFILIDNSEEVNGDLFREIEALLPTQCVASPSNLGYFGGASLGMQYVDEDFDWIVVSNVDLRFQNTQFMDTLSGMEFDDRVGQIAPSILASPSERDLNPFMVRRPSVGRMRTYTYLFRVYWIHLMYELAAIMRSRLRGLFKTKAGRAVPLDAQKIYAAHGSLVILSRKFFEAGGTVNYPSFLFGEEVFLAEQCREFGLSVLYLPGLSCVHDEHVSTGQIRSRRLSKAAFDSSRFLYQRFFK